MQEYVAGLLFSEDRSMVALVRKNRPDWQKGKLNAIGGKIEPDEGPSSAQVREFLEETGVFIPSERWDLKVILEKEGEWRVYFFCAFSDAVFNVSTVEDEQIELHGVCDIMGKEALIPNVKWIIGMCLDPLLGSKFFTINVPHEGKPVCHPDGRLWEFVLPDENGRYFMCSCGCNVFHKPDDRRLNLYQCNSCDSRFTATKVD